MVGVEVHLSSYDPWVAGMELPQVPGIDDTHGWVTKTDSTGMFRFEVPAPTASVQVLWIEPDAFHESRVINFSAHNEEHAALISGDCEVDLIRLAARGAVSGMLRDEAGQPMPGREVQIESHESTGNPSGLSDSTGHYRIDHATLGRLEVSGSEEEFITVARDPVQIRPGEVTDNVDLVIVRAPTICGVVVDQYGASLKGALVSGNTQGEDSSRSCRSQADGSFRLFLQREARYVLSASLDGYRSFLQRDSKESEAPASSGVRLVLMKRQQQLFTVVDERTGAPIERFGSSAESSISGYSDGWPRQKVHPGGRIEIGVFPDIGDVVFEADGYRKLKLRLTPAPPRTEPIVVRLAPAPFVSGRIVREGAPACGLEVRLQGCMVDDEDPDHLVFESEGDPERTRTDVHGRFRFAALPSDHDWVRLRALGPQGTMLELPPFKISGEGVELGDVSLVAGASVTGRVLPPPGRSPAGLTVRLDSSDDDREEITDAEGRFNFDGLRSGLHEIELCKRLGLLESPPSQEFELTSGQHAEVDIDARDFGTCSVALTIRIDSQPAADIDVRLDPAKREDSNDPFFEAKATILGTTDTQGHVEGYALACGKSWVRIRLPESGAEIQARDAVDCRLDRRIDAVLDFELGSVEVNWPAALKVREGLSLDFRLDQADAGGRNSDHRAVRGLDPAANSSRFDRVFAGSFVAHVEIQDLKAQLVSVTLPDGTVTERHPVLSRLETPLTIRGGETTVLQLP